MRRISVCLAFAISIISATSAGADKLEDFKEAVKQKGCHSIPYSDLRNTCTSQQSDVHPWCDGHRGPASCDENVTRNLRNALNEAEAVNASHRERRRELESKRSNATDDAEKARLTAEIERLDREIEVAGRRIQDVRNELSKRKDVVEKTMSTINKCIDYRRAVMHVFAYATDKVRGESDEDIKPYALTLRDKYSAELGDHELEIRRKFSSLETCKAEVP